MKRFSALLLLILLANPVFTTNSAFFSIFSRDSYRTVHYSVTPSYHDYSRTQNVDRDYSNPTGVVFIQNRRSAKRPAFLEQVFGSGRHTEAILQLVQIERSITGYGNNKKNPEFGMCNTTFSRSSDPLYKNHLSEPIDSSFYPRESSNALGIVQHPMKLNQNNVTMAFTIWGQFLDHDLTLTQVNSEEHMDIDIPKCDPYFDASCSNNKKIPFKRSIYSNHHQYPRKHMNSITHWLDGSNVYGSTDEVSKRLRTFQSGKLKVRKNRMLPDKEGDPHGLPDAGDSRAAQNLLLLSYHTLFMREHNRMCDIIIQKEQSLNDEQIYTAARNYITGLIQKITFEQFLPVLLGYSKYQQLIGLYRGYKPKINPSIHTEFATVGFRFGHSLLTNVYPLINQYGHKVDELNLHQIFFRPEQLDDKKMDLIFRGLSRTITKQRDGTIVDDIRNLLIQQPSQRNVFLDLYALNIQRARDHGIEKYNYLRVAYGLKALKNFDQLTSDKERARKLSDFYHGDINNLDPWVGILNEDNVSGGVVGELGAEIIGKTFRNLRSSDRLWYQNVYPQSVIAEIKGTFFSEVVIRNTGVKDLGQDIFHYNPKEKKAFY